MSDLYDVLGVRPTVSAGDLDRAFRGLVRQYHPDTRQPGLDGDADGRLAQILAAYAVLRDPVRRAGYDSQRTRAQAPQQRKPAPRQRKADPAPQAVRHHIPVRLVFVREYQQPLRVGPVHWDPW